MKYDYGFIGCGNMGGAILSCIAQKHPESAILAFDVDMQKSLAFSEKYSNVKAGSLDDALSDCGYVFLGLKPQVLPSFLEKNIDSGKKYECTFVSMAAGTSIEKIASYFAQGVKIIRIMPNIPVSVGQGVVLYCGNSAVSCEEMEIFGDIMTCTGLVCPIEESKIDAGSAVSGCGPAFAYMFIEALADGGVQCGLTRDQAMRFAAQMLLGSAKQVLETGIHPGELKDRVCSPGGTTIAGVHALEENSFRYAASQAVIAAYEKTLGLNK